MKDIIRIQLGAPREEIVGNCRVVRADKLTEITGTTESHKGGVIAPGNAYAE